MRAVNCTVRIDVKSKVRVPDKIEPGRYDACGIKDAAGSVFISLAGPTAHVWAVFPERLEPGQVGAMVFENVAGIGMINGNVCQWLRGGPGDLGQAFGYVETERFNIPNAGEPVIELIAVQRAPDAVRIAGRNRFAGAVNVAAGVAIPAE